MTQDLNAATLVLYGALGGAAVATLGNILNNFLTQRSEARRHSRRLAFELGTKEWEAHFNANEKRGDSGTLPPFLYVHFNLKVTEELFRGTLTPEKWLSLTKERDALGEAIVRGSLARKSQDPKGSH